MSTQLNAMKQALEALELVYATCDWHTDDGNEAMQKANAAVTSLRTAIEQADQDPVAVVSGYYGGQCVVLPKNPVRLFNSGTAFYTTTPEAQRQWVDMPELALLGAYEEEQQGRFGDHARGLLNVQAKLREKNTGETK